MSRRPPSAIATLALFVAAGSSAAAGAEHLVPGQHPTIQGAVDAAAAGDRVVVAAGTYRERVVLKPGVTLVSAGGDERGESGLLRAERTVIDGRVEGADGAGVAMAERSVVDGFTVTGVGAYDDGSWKRHWEERGENQPHEHIGGFGSPGIGADGVSCSIRNCIVHHNGHTGIALRGREGERSFAVVEDNVCYRNMGGGIGIMGDGASGLVRGNRCFENFYAGIGHSDHAAPLVVGNECFENVRAGIGVSEGSCPVVRDNRCYANRRAGIGIRSGSDTRPVVEGNRCYENGMAGIGTEDHAEPVLRDNHCERNAMAGIGARKGARPIIVENTCRENAAAGIGLRPDCEAIVSGNRCEGNKLVAIGLPENARAIISGNVLGRRGGMPPLIAIRGGSKAIVTGNTLDGGGVAGILLEGEALIWGNKIQGHNDQFGQGIWLWEGSRAVEGENEISGFKKTVVSPERREP